MQNLPPRVDAVTSARALLPWIIFPAILLVYLLFPTKNYYWDGVFFARVIEAAPAVNSSLLHPSHLLYNVIGYALYQAARTVGLHWRAIEVLQFANSVVSILTAFLLYQILRRSLGFCLFSLGAHASIRIFLDVVDFFDRRQRVHLQRVLFASGFVLHAWRLQTTSQPGTVVYFHSENSDNNLVAYFNPATEWRSLRDVHQMQTELKQVYDAGKTAWLEASAIDKIRGNPDGNEWLARHGRSETWRERNARGYNLKFIQVGP